MANIESIIASREEYYRLRTTLLRICAQYNGIFSVSRD